MAERIIAITEALRVVILDKIDHAFDFDKSWLSDIIAGDELHLYTVTLRRKASEWDQLADFFKDLPYSAELFHNFARRLRTVSNPADAAGVCLGCGRLCSDEGICPECGKNDHED